MTRIALNEVVDPFGARVVVEVDDDGRAREAWFDLVGLPRVDGLLVGQPVASAPAVVERLCGLCPAAHHLAGVRALDALGGLGVSPRDEDVRRLLHHGSLLEAHAVRWASVDRDAAVLLRRFGRAAMAASGSPGHFPTTAVPGGVRVGADAALLAALAAQGPDAVAAALAVATAVVGASGRVEDAFDGPDVALVDAGGRPDLLGGRLRATASDGAVVVEGALPGEWPTLVAEGRPGVTACRPYLTALGPGAGHYRVGPVAQVRVGVPTTPRAAELRERWLATDGGAAGARAVVTLHAAEVVVGLAAALSGDTPDHRAGSGGAAMVRTVGLAPAGGAGGSGTGWVDGPRGLLVHTYTADADGVLTSAHIITPTAQNEPWLARLLVAAASLPDAERAARLEESIRVADPCLPVSSAPPGAMGLTIDVVRGDHGTGPDRGAEGVR